jgi:predicted lipid carrier protein YhbT
MTLTNELKIPTISNFTLPPLVGKVFSRLPQWPHSVNVTLILNAVHKLGFFPQDALTDIEGRSFRITVLDSGGVADFTYSDGAFRPLLHPNSKADLHFAAPLSAFMQIIARQEDPDTLFFNRILTIEGDTELGLRVKNMLDAVEWPAFLQQLTTPASTG